MGQRAVASSFPIGKLLAEIFTHQLTSNDAVISASFIARDHEAARRHASTLTPHPLPVRPPGSSEIPRVVILTNIERGFTPRRFSGAEFLSLMRLFSAPRLDSTIALENHRLQMRVEVKGSGTRLANQPE